MKTLFFGQYLSHPIYLANKLAVLRFHGLEQGFSTSALRTFAEGEFLVAECCPGHRRILVISIASTHWCQEHSPPKLCQPKPFPNIAKRPLGDKNPPLAENHRTRETCKWIPIMKWEGGEMQEECVKCYRKKNSFHLGKWGKQRRGKLNLN